MRCWRIDEGQTDARHHLDPKTEQGATAKDIEPTVGAGRHHMPSRRREQSGHVQTLVEPEGDTAQHTRSHCYASRWLDRVGSWPPSTHRCPFWTLYSYSNKPRGAGPPARGPSAQDTPP